MRRSSRPLVVFAAIAVVAGAACTTTAPAADPTRSSATPPVPAAVPVRAACNPARMAACALPFPSDTFTVADAATATGRRVAIKDSIVRSRALTGLAAPIRPSNAFANSDGFSPLGPVLFEVDRAPVASSVQDAVVVVDIDTGRRIPMRVEIDGEAARRGSHVVRAWPRSRFEFGHRYAAALTTATYATDGVGYAPAPGMTKVLRASAFAPVLAALATRNVNRADIVSATSFTVRSEANAKDMMRESAARAVESTPAVRNLTVSPNILGIAGIDSFVNGQLRITDFRTADGGWQPNEPGRSEWIDFVMTVPTSAQYTPAPVIVYGHPITFDKGLILIEAGLNAQRGAATIAIDFPNHGSRIALDGGDYDSLIRPEGVAKLVSGTRQGVIDTVALVSAVKTSLASLDVAPLNLAKPLAADGRADLDPLRILYEGTSLGGVFGMPAVALDPRIDGGAYQVSGGALGQLITGSARWYKDFGPNDDIGFRDSLPKGGSGAEASFLIAAVQHALDPVDAVVWADELRNKPMLMINAYADQTVPNQSTQAIAEAAKVPVVGAAAWNVVNTPKLAAVPRNDRFMVQIDTRDWLEVLRNEFGHFSFIMQPAQEALDQWVARQLK